MSGTVTAALRQAAAERPVGRPIGYQRWSDLLFVHWRVPAAALRPLVPNELTIDTWEDQAFVGLVAFQMSGVRPWWFPPVPGISRFAEANVRTYVHHQGRGPGVWFFSLEAAASLAVLVGRWRWGLEYHRARMRLDRRGEELRYESRRRWPGPLPADLAARVALGPAQVASRPADSLDAFLVDRYLLYTARRGGLYRGQVYHRPYELWGVSRLDLEETLLSAAGLRPRDRMCQAVYSPGVDVEVFPLAPVVDGG